MINSIKKAQEITDECYLYLRTFIKEGMSEISIADRIEQFMKKKGAPPAFDTIVVSGERSCLPHGEPTSKLLEAGDFLTVDFGCKVNGYCSDMTRTFAVSYATEEMKKVYDIVLKAQLNALDNMKAGMTCKEADSLCRDYITEKGYGEYFIHGTGHGVGLNVHEEPYLNSRYDGILEENMVVTVEPGIYIPDKYGVRIEDLAIITTSGIINLTKSEKELIII